MLYGKRNTFLLSSTVTELSGAILVPEYVDCFLIILKQLVHLLFGWQGGIAKIKIGSNRICQLHLVYLSLKALISLFIPFGRITLLSSVKKLKAGIHRFYIYVYFYCLPALHLPFF